METVNTDRLKEKEYRKFLTQQFLTGIFLTIVMMAVYFQVLTTASLLTTLSLGGHALYRLHQIWKPVSFYCRNHDTCSDRYACRLFAVVVAGPCTVLRSLAATTRQTWQPAEMEQQQETAQGHAHKNNPAEMDRNKDHPEQNHERAPRIFTYRYGELDET